MLYQRTNQHIVHFVIVMEFPKRRVLTDSHSNNSPIESNCLSSVIQSRRTEHWPYLP